MKSSPQPTAVRHAHRLKSRPRAATLKRELQRRLRRAEGQLRGLQRMIGAETYCIDVLQQIAAVRRALDRLALMLVRDHLGSCVADALSSGKLERESHIEELIGSLDRFLS